MSEIPGLCRTGPRKSPGDSRRAARLWSQSARAPPRPAAGWPFCGAAPSKLGVNYRAMGTAQGQLESAYYHYLVSTWGCAIYSSVQSWAREAQSCPCVAPAAAYRSRVCCGSQGRRFRPKNYRVRDGEGQVLGGEAARAEVGSVMNSEPRPTRGLSALYWKGMRVEACVGGT